VADKSKINILVVDDEPGLCAGIREALRREGYHVDVAHDVPSGEKLLIERLYNVVLTDLRMPGPNGMELFTALRQTSRDTIVILMTAYGTVENAVQALRDGAFDYLTKPIDLTRLRTVVSKALQHQAIVAENHELRLRLEDATGEELLVGNSEELRAVIRLMREVARSEVTVLIEGESGTGKEIVAQTLHHWSPRAQQPFISVNCAALPNQLLEAELFGHVRGAFTGAVATRPGRFQLADGGTLFLDEIGDLSPQGQADLLRVLEDGTFRMVGGTELIRVNVRVIAATNKKLREAVTTGQFREDLFYRLQIVPIEVPPLRARREDIPLLADHFLAHFCAKHQRPIKTMSAAAWQQCQRYDWPGNIRELRNLIERLVITCRSQTIQIEDLPDFLHESATRPADFMVQPGTPLAEVEKALIRHTLNQVTQNREEAARRLGISRRTLQYKLRRYGLLADDSKP
jgi:DNA-binding NtrC family response regulator